MIKILLFLALAAFLLLPVLIALVTALGFGFLRMLNYESRFRKNFVKYDNEEIARMVASGKLWTGQTADQLRDAKGEPDDIQNIQGEEIWLYAGSLLVPQGLRIILKNGRVQEWV